MLLATMQQFVDRTATDDTKQIKYVIRKYSISNLLCLVFLVLVVGSYTAIRRELVGCRVVVENQAVCK